MEDSHVVHHFNYLQLVTVIRKCKSQALHIVFQHSLYVD